MQMNYSFFHLNYTDTDFLLLFSIILNGCFLCYCRKKLNSLKHLVRTTVAESHNKNSKYEKGAIT